MTRSASSQRHAMAGALALLLGLAGGVPAIAQTNQAASGPDLVADGDAILEGVVNIRNAGSSPVGVTVATISCVGPGDAACPQRPLMIRFSNPSQPDVISVNIPPLGPGESYRYELPFWNTIEWPAGEFRLTVRADASSSIAESDEFNNDGVATLVKP